METVVLSRIGCWRSHPHVLGVGDGPPPLPGLDRLIFAPQASFKTSITLGALFVTLLLLFFAKPESAYHDGRWGQ